MATLLELEKAFLKAHAAGDKESASVLARAVKNVRQEQAAAQEEASFQNRDAALARGLQQGVTLGFADELKGGLAAGLEGLKSIFDDRPVLDTIKDTYTDKRDSERAKLERDRELNPNTAMIGNIVGSLAPTPAMVGKIFQGAKGLAGAVTKGSATGAGVGAAQGLGYSEGETLGDVAKDTAIGGVIGAAVPVTLKGATMVAKGVSKGAKALQATGKSLQTGTLIAEARRSQTKLMDAIEGLSSKKQDLIDKKSVLQSSGANQKELTKVNNQIKNIETDIKVKERQILKEQTKVEPDLLDENLEEIISNVVRKNKRVSAANNIVDALGVFAVGTAAGNPLIGLGASVGKKVVLDKLLKSKGIDLNIGEMGVTGFNKLKKGLGSASKLSGSALTKLTDGITGLSNKIPEGYRQGFEQAFAMGGNTAGIYHYYLLTTDPKYRQAMKDIVAEEGKSLMFNDKSTKESK